MDIENILKLVHAVSDSELTEFSYEEGNIHLKLSKKQKQTAIQLAEPGELPVALPTVSTVRSQTARSEEEKTVSQVEGKEIQSPLVGTFYSAPSPDEAAFVKVGDQVRKGQTLGIVEAMKLMNEIESEYDGEVKAILVENEEVVEYGQPLFIIG
ncbi:MAG: acetyl-CoA carboxylase biotin carboxyl carrier protein [Lachnospiraceae bacterium]|nr:acetyl-CoA carboxylase biotin carboxyl carrier protein [Lachnospiraceae bacterium]